MNKTGVVLQIEKNKAILMTSSGEFTKVKIPSKAPNIGDTYTGKVFKEINFLKYVSAIACLFFMFLTGGGAYAYYSPVASAEVNINPSLELKINRFDRIIKCVPLNTDGEVLLSHLNIKNTTVEKGLSQIVEEAKKENFINDNYITSGKVISINVKSDSKKKNFNLSKFESSLAKNNLNVNINNNGNETKIGNGTIKKTINKATPAASKKTDDKEKNNTNNNDSTGDINKDNNGDTNPKNNDDKNPSEKKNNPKASPQNNTSSKGNANSHNDPSDRYDNNSNNYHPSDASGHHTPDPGKSKKK